MGKKNTTKCSQKRNVYRIPTYYFELVGYTSFVTHPTRIYLSSAYVGSESRRGRRPEIKQQLIEMATRELTRAFVQLRKDAKAKSLRRKNITGHGDEGNALMKNGDWDATHVAVAPGWVDVVNETNEHVAHIRSLSTCRWQVLCVYLCRA